MSCYQPYFGGVAYFSVLSRCGFEEQGGIVDCIQPINMSGINDLLVSQGDSAMSRPESLHELEELLEFPPHVSVADLDSRFRDLCLVLQKARDTFSCRVEEEQENPFQELRLQLQKAKDRFSARIAEGNAKSSHGSFQTKTGSDVNPVQELRDAFRKARKHFVPLLDQYISNVYNGNNAATETASLHLGGSCRPIAVEISRANAVDCSTILRANPMNNNSSTRPPNAHNKNKSTPGTFSRSLGGVPCYGPTYGRVVTNSDQSKASRLEALITKELQGRQAGGEVYWNEDSNDGEALSMSQTMEPTSEVEADAFERLSSTSKEDFKGGCAPGLFARMRLPAFPVHEPTSLAEGDAFEELSSTEDGKPAAAATRTPENATARRSTFGNAPDSSFEPLSSDRVSLNVREEHDDRDKSPTAIKKPAKIYHEN